MKKLFNKIINNLSLEKEIIKRNKAAINERNTTILKTILVGSMLIFGTSFLATFSVSGAYVKMYENLRSAYFSLVIVCAAMYIVLKLNEKMSSVWALYCIYGIGVLYCIITSAFASPEFVSVVILAVIFQLPVLYVDNSIRIDAFVFISATTYLICIYPYKNALRFTDEAVNVIAFSVIALIIGKFTRNSLLENFANKETLEAFAYTDQLTQLCNRRKLFDDWDNKENADKISGVLLIDIDHFKSYNDTYGHQAGDECLKTVADCFSDFHDEFGIPFYRYGGEEFMAVFTKQSQSEILVIANNINKAVFKKAIPHVGCEKGYVSISIGCAAKSEGDSLSYEALIKNADLALYSAKQKGRDCVLMHEG